MLTSSIHLVDIKTSALVVPVKQKKKDIIQCVMVHLTKSKALFREKLSK